MQYIEEKQKELQKVFPGNEVFTVIEKGITSSKIVAIASMWQADLIVVGSYGFKGAEQLFLGSVADEVVEKAPCTVEIIRSATLIASRHDASFNFERIAMVPWSKVLVGCNFSTNATEAVKWIPTQQWEGVQRSFWLMLWFLANPPQTLSDSGSATNE